MKQFQSVAFDPLACRTQLDELRAHLAANAELAENRDVLPFFRDRPQLASLLGMFNPRIGVVDRIAYEFDVFGDFACDLAVGEWNTGQYCFVEFEDAVATSVFVKKGAKATREWSAKFDHGFSQIVDWCFKLQDRVGSSDMLTRFGKHTINYEAVLVVGRDHHLDAGELARLEWRTSHVTVNSKKVTCLTFDQLLNQLATRLAWVGISPPASPTVPGA
ncbi:MAG: DUF4263 domain-containing protein [Gemmataceae bacterium]